MGATGSPGRIRQPAKLGCLLFLSPTSKATLKKHLLNKQVITRNPPFPVMMRIGMQASRAWHHVVTLLQLIGSSGRETIISATRFTAAHNSQWTEDYWYFSFVALYMVISHTQKLTTCQKGKLRLRLLGLLTIPKMVVDAY